MPNRLAVAGPCHPRQVNGSGETECDDVQMPSSHQHHTRSSRCAQYLAGYQAWWHASIGDGALTSRYAQVVLLDADSPKPCLDNILI